MEKCLNCNTPLKDNYCSKCGQKASTHRYSVKHFLMHDFINGTFYLNKGFFYTMKELFTRPGHSIREFINGKRVSHINCLTLLFLVVMLAHLLGEFTPIKIADLVGMDSRNYITKLEEFSTTYPRLFILASIPIYATFSAFWFAKAKQNFTEHLILNSYKASGELILSALFTLLTIFYRDISVLTIFYLILTLLILSYSTWFYYQYFSAFGYRKFTLLIRSVLTALSMIFLTATITYIIFKLKV